MRAVSIWCACCVVDVLFSHACDCEHRKIEKNKEERPATADRPYVSDTDCFFFCFLYRSVFSHASPRSRLSSVLAPTRRFLRFFFFPPSYVVVVIVWKSSTSYHLFFLFNFVFAQQTASAAFSWETLLAPRHRRHDERVIDRQVTARIVY